MPRGRTILAMLGTGLILAACGSGPSKSGPGSAQNGQTPAEKRTQYFADLLARRGEAGRVWSAITAALPAGVWLTEAAYDLGKVRIKGRTATNNLLADFITRLGASPRLAEVALGGSVMKTVRGREIQEFSLTAAAAGAGEGAAPASGLEERPDAAAVLREVQRLALESGFRMTKFSPGAEAPG